MQKCHRGLGLLVFCLSFFKQVYLMLIRCLHLVCNAQPEHGRLGRLASRKLRVEMSGCLALKQKPFVEKMNPVNPKIPSSKP